MILRPRQQTLVDRAKAALEARGNTLCVAPTGAGKTVMLAACADPLERTLVLQHRTELVRQNSGIFAKLHGARADIGVVDAKDKEFDRRSVFAMVQTLAREGSLARIGPVDLLAIDEAHHSAAGSWDRIVENARALNRNVRILGMTATPGRGDGQSLRAVFDNVADQIKIGELIASGHLVPPRTFVIDLGVRDALKGVKVNISDFDMSEVERIMDKRPLNEAIVEHWKDKAEGRKTVVFASTIEHASHVAEAFGAGGVPAATVDHNMSRGERAAILERFESGDLKVLVNVAILTEGWDCQPVSCVLLLRPSSHKSTMIQMIGRGLRTVDPEKHPGVVKGDCVVMDFGTSTLIHGSLEADVSLEEKTKGAAPHRECPVCGASVPLSAKECPICGSDLSQGNQERPKEIITDFTMIEIELLKSSPFKWVDIWKDDSILVASAFECWGIVVWFFGNWHAIGGSRSGGIKSLAVGEKTLALAAADDWLREHGDSAGAAKSKTWLNLPATIKQKEMLGLGPFEGAGLSRYNAACRLTWKFNERGIRAKLTAASREAA